MMLFMLLAVAQLVALMPLARAQSYEVHPDYTVERWTTREGLPANTVIGLGQRQILQGADGYLWFTTIEGLVRFDGLRFTVFAAGDTPGLLSNRIIALVEAPPGTLWLQDEQWNITRYYEGQFTSINDGNTSGGYMKVLQDGPTTWIGTGQGLAYYRDGHLVPYRQDVFKGGVISLVRDVEGAIWVKTTSGQPLHAVLYRIEPGAEPEAEDAAEPVVWSSGLPQLVAKSQLLPDRWRGVWAATERGLVHLAADHVLAHYPYPETWQDQIQQVDLHHQDAEGGLLVGVVGLADKRSITNGWGRLNPDGTYTAYPLSEPDRRIQAVVLGPHGALWRIEEPWNQQDTSRARLFRGAIPIFKVVGSILDFAFTSDGNVWVLTATEGLFRLRRAALISVGEPEGLPSTSANIVLEDRSGVIWVSTSRGGFARLKPDSLTMRPTFVPVAFPFRNVQSLHEDRSGTLWTGSSILCRIAGNQCLVVETPFNRIRVIHEDRHGRFWVGSDLGLIVGQRRGEDLGSWTRLLSPLDQAHNRMLAILETRDGTLLFGTNGNGLLRYTGGPGPPDSSQAQTKTAPGAFETLTTADGLLSNNIRDLYEDAEGYLWIALEDQGLCRLSPGFTEGLHVADLGCLSKRDGLYHNGLHRILEDDQGRFWFNTNNGIFWVERAALMARLADEIPAVASVSYTEAEGMRNREGNGGTQPAGTKASDGRLWFPTQGGVVIIDPQEISLPAPPPVVLETAQIGDEPRRNLAHSQEQLALRAEERDIAFHYTALAFTRPQDVRFQVRLVGYDDTWNDVGARREAQYTNLPPGRYRFEVRAGRGGVWGKTATLALRRPPLFWETTWFYVLLGLMALGAVGAFVIYRTRRHRAREADLERVVAERTEQLARQAEALHKTNEALHKASEVKSRFLANISHEFRTPLTLTFGPISDLVEGRFNGLEEARPHFERARRNGHRLLRLINQLLELSRLDAGMMQLQVERQDLALFLRHIAALFEGLAHQRHQLFTRDLPDDPFWHVFDVDKLEKVVVNLLSNAFKFTPPHGKVSLSLTQAEDGGVRIEVADTGPGIAAEHLPRLFDRFYQIEQAATRAHEGSGIGLSLAKELVDLHEGRIEVESAVGFGSRFIVLLPPLKATAEGAPATETSATTMGDGHKAGIRRVVEGEQYALSLVIQDGPAQEPVPEAEEENETVVLVVEDNADMRAYIRAHLASDYRVVEAAHGKAGVTLAQDWVPDLVLSDVMMPEMDGLELCATLKADVRTSHIPVVLLTAKAEVENRIAGFESGADAYLPKPFDAEELRVRVRTLIEERQRLRVLFGGSESASSAEQATPVLPPQEAAFLAQVQETIAANLSDAEFGVGQLAEAVYMSRRQLLRKLQALITETPSELLRRTRMEKARALLQKGIPAKEVAHSVGFKSYPSFSHAFNNAYGTPPSVYAQTD